MAKFKARPQIISKIIIPLAGVGLIAAGFIPKEPGDGTVFILVGLVFLIASFSLPSNKCYHCKQPVSPLAKICPHCGDKHSMRLRNVVPVILVIFVGIIVLAARQAIK